MRARMKGKRHRPDPHCAGTRRFSFLVGALALLVAGAGQADVQYEMQAVVARGDSVAEGRIRLGSPFQVGPLNENGEAMIVAEVGGGAQVLVQYTGGKLQPVVAPGTPAPGGEWGPDVRVLGPVSMNERGNAVFAANLTTGGRASLGTFLWERQAERVTPVALRGMPAGSDLVIQIAGAPVPVVNNRDEIAFPAYVKNPSGKVQYTVLFRGQDGAMRPVALPDQPLPGGGKVQVVRKPSLNDNGGMAVLLRRQGDERDYPYLWVDGALQSLPMGTAPALPGRLFLGFDGVWPDRERGNALVAAHFHTPAAHTWGLYRVTGGKSTPVAVPGQAMPGGGKLITVDPEAVSGANAAGEHVFSAIVSDGNAVFRMDGHGQVSLLLKSGMATPLGRIAGLGTGAGRSVGVGLNDKGQILLPLRMDGGTDVVALLTPAQQ